MNSLTERFLQSKQRGEKIAMLTAYDYPLARLLELVIPETSKQISESIAIPTIGIGAGTGCDGQVLVTHDLAGMFPWFKPKFVTQRADVAAEIRKAVSGYIEETKL